MMTIWASSTVKTLPEQWRGEVQSGTHQYLTDKPVFFAGQDAGPAPYDFLTASLASCTMITLRMYAKHKGINLGEFRVSVEFYHDETEQEFIERHLHFVHPLLDDALAVKILDICSKTPVTKTLLRSVAIHTHLL